MSDRPKIIVTSPLLPGQSPDTNIDVLRYVEALRRFDADPIVLAKGNATTCGLNEHGARGILFSGGGDIDARYYNGHGELCVGVDPERDEGEIELFQDSYFNNVPILAICRGMQIANVALGGSLIEDIPRYQQHKKRITHHTGVTGPERFENIHTIRCLRESRLESIVRASRVRVNSVHHQAIRELAGQLIVSAYSDDGIIEAIEPDKKHPGFFIGVQWHPEALPADDEVSRAIFGAFVASCRTPDEAVTVNIL